MNMESVHSVLLDKSTWTQFSVSMIADAAQYILHREKREMQTSMLCFAVVFVIS